MKKVLWLAWLMYSCASYAAEIAIGEYITDGGWSTLNVTTGFGTRNFLISAMGANGHSCTLRGELRNGQAKLKASDPAKPCVVTFMPRIDGIVVGAKASEICREFCGARATFEGTYLRSPATCTRSQVRRARAKFKSQYDQKSFAAARATLEPVLKKCDRMIFTWTQADMQNDLALVQHRLNDNTACLATLAPLSKAAAMTDDEIANTYPPVEAEEMRRIAKAARANLKLCGASQR